MSKRTALTSHIKFQVALSASQTPTLYLSQKHNTWKHWVSLKLLVCFPFLYVSRVVGVAPYKTLPEATSSSFHTFFLLFFKLECFFTLQDEMKKNSMLFQSRFPTLTFLAHWTFLTFWPFQLPRSASLLQTLKCSGLVSRNRAQSHVRWIVSCLHQFLFHSAL